MKIYIDSNVFLRGFEELESAVNFFNKVKGGDVEYIVPSVVINEVGWILGKFYKLSRPEVVDYLERILNTAKFEIKYKYDIRKAIEVYKNINIKLYDCYVWSYMDEGDVIVSYDRDFDKLPGIKRIEP